MKTLFFLLLTGSLMALPSGNPSAPAFYNAQKGLNLSGGYLKDCELCLGFYGDYVFNRNLAVSGYNQSAIYQTEIFTNAGLITFNVANRFSLFATLGASNFSLSTPLSSFAPTSAGNDMAYLYTDSNWVGSVGARVLLGQYRGLAWGLSGQYLRTSLPLNYFYSNFKSSSVTYLSSNMAFSEWQVTGGISYELILTPWYKAVPYVTLFGGSACAQFDNISFPINLSTSVTLFDLKSAQNFGYALGLSLLGGERFSLTVEGRFVAEKAFSLIFEFLI